MCSCLVLWSFIFFFFFKQKTAYEIMPSLVGSEMCIRDRCRYIDLATDVARRVRPLQTGPPAPIWWAPKLLLTRGGGSNDECDEGEAIGGCSCVDGRCTTPSRARRRPDSHLPRDLQRHVEQQDAPSCWLSGAPNVSPLV